MALTLKLDLDIVKMYHHTKNEVSMSRHSKVIACTDRQTHRQTQIRRQYESIIFPHMRVVKIYMSGAYPGGILYPPLHVHLIQPFEAFCS